MRVRTRGSHHQKFVVLRHRDDPSRDIAYVGGIDLCHSRRDDSNHAGDRQALELAEEYGATPPWHDVQAAISGPAVHDVETVFRERWEDPAPLDGSSHHWWSRIRSREVASPSPLAEQGPPPPAVPGGTHQVQLLRTYPHLPAGRDYRFAPGGERSVARGYRKAIGRARRLIYVEDQYLWGGQVADMFGDALDQNPDLVIIGVVPLYTDLEGALGRLPQHEGQRRALQRLLREHPDRIAVYGLENRAGTPIYVHAKACVIDDTWATVGSDNFNRRSWTHDSELSAVVLDTDGAYARDLRLTLAAEHLGRDVSDPADLLTDLLDPAGMFAAYAASAERLDAWHGDGQKGPRPPGQLRRMEAPRLGLLARAFAALPYAVMHDPDGRPRRLRRSNGY